MSNTTCLQDLVLTKEHRRFAEFCDACRHYGYIGLCYGTPGVGKTLSARHYANWNQVEAYSSSSTSDAELTALLGSNTVFYTPKVVNSPRQIEQDIQMRRNRLRAIPLEALRREEEPLVELARQQDAASKEEFFLQTINTLYAPPSERPVKPESKEVFEIVKTYAQKREETPEPTTLVMIDEADRLKTAGLEQVRDIFDQGGLGVILIGMPGLEKRLSRYPQLYSRVGFVHEFCPLSAKEMCDLFRHQWAPSGVVLPEKGLNDEDVLATIIRITGGNFRLLHRLLTQVARLVEINALSQITREVVEAARENLVIGIV